MKNRVSLVITFLFILFLSSCTRINQLEDTDLTDDGEITMELDLRAPLSAGYTIDKVSVTLEHNLLNIPVKKTVLIASDVESTIIHIDELLIGSWDIEIVLFENETPVAGGKGQVEVFESETSSATITMSLGTGNIDIGLEWEPVWHLATSLPSSASSHSALINDNEIIIASKPMLHGTITPEPFDIQWNSADYPALPGQGGMVIANEYLYKIVTDAFPGSESPTSFLHWSEIGPDIPWRTTSVVIPAISENSWDGYVYRYNFELDSFMNRIYAIGGYARLGGKNTAINDMFVCGAGDTGGLGGFNRQSLPFAVQNPVVEVNNDFLWVLGGTDYYGTLYDKFYAAILTDSGTVQSWSQNMIAPSPMKGASLTFYMNNIILVGGTTATGASSKVYFAKVDESGKIDYWREGPSLSGPRTNHSAVMYDNKLIIFGGNDGLISSKKVEYIDIGSIVD